MKCEIIAEFGVNHIINGNIIPNLEESIKQLSEKGASTIKFQHFYAKELVKENTPKCEYHAKRTKTGYKESQFDMIKNLEISIDDHKWLKNLCLKHGVKYLCTPLSEKSLDELLSIGQKEIKISSCDCGNLKFLHDLVDRESDIDRVILSTGMSTFNEILKSVYILNKGNFIVDVLHCTSSYPTKPNNTNLAVINQLQNSIANNIGFSDHTIGVHAAMIARSLGCKIFEKHVTPNLDMEGPDHLASMAIDSFKQYTDAIELAHTLMGSNKQIQDSEKELRALMKKGMWFTTDLLAGSTIEKQHIILSRPAQGTTSAYFYYDVIGKTTTKDVKKGDPIEINRNSM